MIATFLAVLSVYRIAAHVAKPPRQRVRSKSDYGECEIAVPCDRNGEFDPKIIAKRQTQIDEIKQKIMAMYAK